MILEMQCPFYKRKRGRVIWCEGGQLCFRDPEGFDYMRIRYCANNTEWKKCSVAKQLLDYYERKEDRE